MLDKLFYWKKKIAEHFSITTAVKEADSLALIKHKKNFPR